jgi:hypothetical protein
MGQTKVKKQNAMYTRHEKRETTVNVTDDKIIVLGQCCTDGCPNDFVLVRTLNRPLEFGTLGEHPDGFQLILGNSGGDALKIGKRFECGHEGNLVIDAFRAFLKTEEGQQQAIDYIKHAAEKGHAEWVVDGKDL